MGSWKGRGNQHIQFARVVYCKLPTNSKQLPFGNVSVYISLLKAPPKPVKDASKNMWAAKGLTSYMVTPLNFFKNTGKQRKSLKNVSGSDITDL